jgi:hypothetical protein
VTCHGWYYQVCGLFCHKCITVGMFYLTVIMTFSFVLMCSDIVHGRHKSIRHRGVSRLEHVGS